jgi:hypothetical protein
MRISGLRKLSWLSIFVIVLLSTACGGGGGSDSSSSASVSTGTLQVALTDAVDPRLKEVVISIREIRAVPNGRDAEKDRGLPLIKTFDPSLVVNVLDLAYQQELLGEALVPAGTYNQIRLILDENADPAAPVNYVTFKDNTQVGLDAEEFNLKTPSGQTSGLKVLGKFTVLPGEITAIALDFDPAKAIHETKPDQWMLKPTGIRIVAMQDMLPQYGAIAGQVLAVGDVPVTGAVVSIVPVDSEAAIASGVVVPEDATFRALLPAGTYIVHIDAEGYQPVSSDPESFAVKIGEETEAGVFYLTAL